MGADGKGTDDFQFGLLPYFQGPDHVIEAIDAVFSAVRCIFHVLDEGIYPGAVFGDSLFGDARNGFPYVGLGKVKQNRGKRQNRADEIIEILFHCFCIGKLYEHKLCDLVLKESAFEYGELILFFCLCAEGEPSFVDQLTEFGKGDPAVIYLSVFHGFIKFRSAGSDVGIGYDGISVFYMGVFINVGTECGVRGEDIVQFFQGKTGIPGKVGGMIIAFRV